MKKLTSLVLACILAGPALAQDEKVFSGPQQGEKLASFKYREVLGKSGGEEVDPIKTAGGKPTLLIFVHARTRPGFALVSSLMLQGQKLKAQGLHTATVFLSDDPTEEEAFIKRITGYLPKGMSTGVSLAGIEGPGSYGLNRKVTLTILLGDKGKVVENYALIQPSVQADGPKILKTLAKLTKTKPAALVSIQDELTMMRVRDKDLVALIDKLKKAKDDAAVKAATEALEEYIGDDRRRRGQLGNLAGIALRMDSDKKLAPPVRRELARLARRYGRQRRAPARRDTPRKGDTKRKVNPERKAAGNRQALESLVRPVINKEATPEEVDKLAAIVDKRVKDDKAAARELGRIASNVVNAGNKYGTPRAQEHIKRWAKEHGPKNRASDRKRGTDRKRSTDRKSEATKRKASDR